MNHRRTHKGQDRFAEGDSTTKLSTSSEEGGDIRKLQSKDKRQHHFKSTVHPALASRGFASHVFLVLFSHGAPKSSRNSFKGVLAFQVELEFGNVGICGGRKTEEPGEKPSEQGREPTTNSTHI